MIDALIDLKQNEKVARKVFCKQFFQERLTIIVEYMSQAISFQRFLDHILKTQKSLQFKDFRDVIIQMFYNQSSMKVVL